MFSRPHPRWVNLSFFGGCALSLSLLLSFWRLTRLISDRRVSAHTPGFLTGSRSQHTAPGSDRFFRQKAYRRNFAGQPSTVEATSSSMLPSGSSKYTYRSRSSL